MKPPAPGPDRPRPPLRLGDRRVVYSPQARPDWWLIVVETGGSVSYTVGRRVYDWLAKRLKPWEGDS